MAFVKKTWTNRISEFFNRYRVENVQTGAVSKVYMNLDDGVVTQEGDVIDADTMNDLENRIENALADVGKGSNWVGTTEEWEALTDEEKAEYDTYDLTDDYSGRQIDTVPTAGSPNLVTSGGVYSAMSACVLLGSAKTPTTANTEVTVTLSENMNNFMFIYIVYGFGWGASHPWMFVPGTSSGVPFISSCQATGYTRFDILSATSIKVTTGNTDLGNANASSNDRIYVYGVIRKN